MVYETNHWDEHGCKHDHNEWFMKLITGMSIDVNMIIMNGL